MISHRSLRRSTRRARVTVAPVTSSDSSRNVTWLIPISSLNRIRNLNAVAPSCAGGIPGSGGLAGIATKLAVSGTTTSAVAALVRVSRVPPPSVKLTAP